MKVTGIIAEYNPFHNGHFHHIKTARTQSYADYVVVIMSGDFTQRGIPALISKYERTKHALLAGADLVLELPMPYAVSSAEYFSLGSLSILDALGVVDTVCFGTEQDDLSSLINISHIISTEPEFYQTLLKQNLSKGYSFPKAQQEALQSYDKTLNLSLLASPNNRLGLEYLKALHRLKSNISPLPIKRLGQGYDETTLSQDGETMFSSATAIRQFVTNHQSNLLTNNLESLKDHVPEFVWTDLKQNIKQGTFLLPKDLDLLLHYKLLQETAESLQTYQDINEDIANKIINHLPAYTSFETFCSLLKSKDLTYTRISRMLLHVLLNLRKDDMDLLTTLSHIPYGRILGFRKQSSPLLHAIKENGSIPIISKLADASIILSPDAMHILNKNICSAHIYEAILSQKTGSMMNNEYTRPIIIL